MGARTGQGGTSERTGDAEALPRFDGEAPRGASRCRPSTPTRPALQMDDGGVHLRLFRSADAARDASVAGVRRLVELAVQKATLRDLGQLHSPTAKPTSHPLQKELAALVPPRFLEKIPFERLPHMPHYLKALLVRAERAAHNPLKDKERAAQVAPYEEALRKLLAEKLASAEAQAAVEEFRSLLEEFRVSIFAQELGMAVPVSPKRLDQQLRRIRESAR